MLVKVYEVNADAGTETFLHHSDLRDCFPDDDGQYDDVRAMLQTVGRTWIGGGGAPLFLLMRAN
jgi:hypothetical protein